jgi:hypothetical protein
MMKLLTMLIFSAMFFFTTAFAETSVSRIVMTEKIENKEPVGSATEFKSDVGRIFCFTEIETDSYPTEITHIWIYDKNIEAEIKLPVRSPKWRTFSSKTIMDVWQGDWKIEVYSENGKLIDSIDFKINE